MRSESNKRICDLDGAGRAADDASANVVWLLDTRNSVARVASKDGADEASHDIVTTHPIGC